MVTSRKPAPRAPIAGDVVYAQLDELRTTHDVLITHEGVTVTERATGFSCGYVGTLAGCIARAHAGEPPDVR